VKTAPETFKEITALAHEKKGAHSSEVPAYCNTLPADKARYETWNKIMADLKYEGDGK
jgi:hypothetical protein